MSSWEEIYHNKTDDELLEAASCINDFTEEVKQVILAETKNRGINVSPLVNAIEKMQETPPSENIVAHCNYCGTRIFFGGRRDGNRQFCNEECRDKGILLAVSQSVPDAYVSEQLWRLHQGNCPKCGGSGPVDVHTSYRVWSAFTLTKWSNRPVISCRSCGMKAKLVDLLFSTVFGWWGFWGLIITPMQIYRNLSGMMKRRDDQRPSAQLEKLTRIRLAAEIVAAQSDPSYQESSGTFYGTGKP